MRRLRTYIRKYPKQFLLLVGVGVLVLTAVLTKLLSRRRLAPVSPVPDPALLQKALEAARNEIAYENTRASVELSKAYQKETSVREEAAQIVANKNGSERRKQMAALAKRVRAQ